MSEEVKKEKEEEVQDWETIAKALATDLVEMSQSVRTVLANSTFNFNVLDEVKLLEMTTASVLNTYISTEEENDQKEA